MAYLVLNGPEQRFSRIYDGTPTTPRYIQCIQLDQPEHPAMPPRGETAIQLDGGRMSANAATYITDPATPFNPIPITFRFAVIANRNQQFDAFGNPRRKATWTVGAHTWVPVGPEAIGNRLDVEGLPLPAMAPRDAVELSGMYTYAWTEQIPSNVTGGTAIYAVARGLVTKTATNINDGRMNYWTIEAMIHGELNLNLTAWPTGVESVPT
jgi:hypothetical protein